MIILSQIWRNVTSIRRNNVITESGGEWNNLAVAYCQLI
jgi:hypothetical protein